MDDDESVTRRRTPVGEPVVRGDERVVGEHAADAVAFDPDDPESIDLAADIVRTFARHSDTNTDSRYLLRGAAACAVLVRGLGSYTAAAERAGEPVTVSFIRKWARVHDLARPIRIQVANGTLAPSAAKHIARLEGAARYDVAWATIDHDLSVREIRTIVTEIANGRSPATVLEEHDADLGHLDVALSPKTYRAIRRLAAMDGVDPGDVIDEAIEELLDSETG